MIKNKRSMNIVLSLVLIFFIAGCDTEPIYVDPIEMNEESSVPEAAVNNEEAFLLIKEIQSGWNLGNTLDSTDFKKQGINTTLNGITPEAFYETYWSNPITTKKMIDQVANAGFGAVRIPITYYDHINGEYIVSQDWLLRIEEVVNYVLDNNMYCIINLHHEEAWLNAEWDEVEDNSKELAVVWKQIADHFKSYNERLIFEGFNELINKKKNWTDAAPSSYEAINVLNQTFVDTVRSSGGYNKERFLMVSTYGANVDDDALGYFKLPNDSIEGRLIVDVHTYAPLLFNWYQEDVTWETTRNDWRQSDVLEIKSIFKNIDKYLISQDIPVVLGEFGSVNKINTEERVDAVLVIVEEAKKLGIAYFWWDSGGVANHSDDVYGYALLNRDKLTWYYPEIVKILTQESE